MEILKLIFRKKTLTSILFIIIAAIIRESLALGFDEEFDDLFNLIGERYKDESGFVLILVAIAKIIFSKGSWITLSILAGLLLFIGFLKYKELSKTNEKRPFLDLQLYSDVNRPAQHNRGISHQNDSKKSHQIGQVKYNFEWHWKWQLKIRNNSESTAYNVKLYFLKEGHPFNYLERFNSSDPIKSNESKDLLCNLVIKKAISGNNAGKYRNSKYPPEKGIESLEIIAEYQDDSRNKYYTLFKENSGQIVNEYLNKKPKKFKNSH